VIPVEADVHPVRPDAGVQLSQRLLPALQIGRQITERLLDQPDVGVRVRHPVDQRTHQPEVTLDSDPPQPRRGVTQYDQADRGVAGLPLQQQQLSLRPGRREIVDQ
jgi:hypothetical protein